MIMEAYCMKCKEKRAANDVKDVTMKNGKPAQEGVCPVCGTRMFRIGAAKTAATTTTKDAEPEKAAATAPAKGKGSTKGKSAAK
jgi:predicted  nucleic acid-binding Zn-ribbon protein